MTKKQVIANDQSVPGHQRKDMPGIRRKFGLFLAAAFLVVGTMTGLGIGLWLLLLETGDYPTSHGFRIDGKAYRALQDASKLQPGKHLVVRSKRASVGPESYMDLRLTTTFDKRECVTLQTRGITFEVENGLLRESTLRPIITHRGNKPTEGYVLSILGQRPSGLDH